MKIAVLIFIISLILPIFAYKLKSPEFLNSLELKIFQFQELSSYKFVEKKDFYEINLNDPFKLSKKAKISTQAGLSEKLTKIPYVSLIYKGKKSYAVVGESIVKEGDRIGDFRVIKILNDRVLIKDKKGEKRWLRLENY